MALSFCSASFRNTFPKCRRPNWAPASLWAGRLASSLEKPDLRCSLTSCQKLQQPVQVCRDENCKADMRGLKRPFAGRRFYDLRQQCITEMLEADIPEGVIREVAGHIDPAMTRHYSHLRIAARWAAVAVLSAVKPPQSAPSEVGHVTKALLAAGQNS